MRGFKKCTPLTPHYFSVWTYFVIKLEPYPVKTLTHKTKHILGTWSRNTHKAPLQGGFYHSREDPPGGSQEVRLNQGLKTDQDIEQGPGMDRKQVNYSHEVSCLSRK